MSAVRQAFAPQPPPGTPSPTARRTAPTPTPTLRLVPDGTSGVRLRHLPQPQPQPWDPRRTEEREGSARQVALPLAEPAGRGAVVSFADPVPTPVAQLPCPEQLARQLVQAAVDVVRGHRPASQLLRWTTPEVFSSLRQRARLEQAAGRTGGRRPVVRSLRSVAVGGCGVEVAAVVLDGARARAVAVRLDGADGRWRMTALVIG